MSCSARLPVYTLVIAAFTVDVNGNESPDGDAPIREDWVFGAEGLSKVAGLVFQMQGTLGVESNAAQPLYLNRPVTVGDVKAYVQAAPTGAAISTAMLFIVFIVALVYVRSVRAEKRF